MATDPAGDGLARLRAAAAATPLLQTLGAEVAEGGAGRCTIVAPFDARFAQQNGFLHAGAVTTLLDAAAGFAALSAMAEGSDVLSVEFKVNLLAPAAAPRFEAVAEVIRAGRTLTTVRADLFALTEGTSGGQPGEPQRRIVATLLGTMIRRPG